MSAPTPYLHFPGTAGEALAVYADIFGGTVTSYSYGDFNRTDGPADAVAHGQLTGLVTLFASDAFGADLALSPTTRPGGVVLALLGTADPATLTEWFARLSDGGTVIDALQQRPWGASDGQVIDRYGVHWLIGFEPDPAEDPDR